MKFFGVGNRVVKKGALVKNSRWTAKQVFSEIAQRSRWLSSCPSRAGRLGLPADKEVAMKTPNVIPVATRAILTLAEIKAATEAFEQGEVNAFDALNAIVAAVEAYQAAVPSRREAS